MKQSIDRKLSTATRCSLESLERRTLLSTTQIDLTFGHGGVVLGPPNQTLNINDIAVQSDGKVLAAGFGFFDALTRVDDFTIARYNVDGTPDTSFGANGLVWTDFHHFSDRPVSIVALPGGKFLVAGNAETRGDTNGYGELTVVRYNSDGSIDTTFAVNGIFAKSYTVADFLQQMTVQADGKILLVGQMHTSTAGQVPLVVRLNTDGTLDNTFGDQGMVSPASSGIGRSILVQPDGKIMLLNDIWPDGFDVIRLNTDGSVDTTYAAQGHAVVPLDLRADQSKLLLQADGKVIVSSSDMPADDPDRGASVMARLSTDGALDPTFGTGGVVNNTFGQTYCWCWNAALEPDGRIVQVGSIDSHFATVRYNVDGTLDASFGRNGVQLVSLGNSQYFQPGLTKNDFATAVAVRPEGSILVGGSPDGFGRFTMIEYSPDPTITVTPDGALLVRGSNNADDIRLSRPAGSNNLAILMNGKTYQVYAPLGVLVDVEAGGGDDIVVANSGVGSCLINGGDGNDSLVGSDGNDSISGNAGKDRIDGGGGDDRVAGNGGNDDITGGEGRDRVYGDAGNDAEVGGSGADRMWGGDGNDLVSGNSGSDILYGDGGINTLAGGTGTDRIYDFARTDVLIVGGDPTIRLVDPETGLITLIEELA